MKIKNKFKYIFVFGIVLVILLSLSINIFADDATYYYNIVNTGSGTRPIIDIDLDINNIDKITSHNQDNNYISNYDLQYYYKLYFQQYVNTSTINRSMYLKLEDNDDWYANLWSNSSSSSNILGSFDIYMNVDYCNMFIYVSTVNFNNSDLSGHGQKLSINYGNNNFIFHDGDVLYLRNYYSGRYALLTLYIHCTSSSQPLTKTYNTGSFYNSGDEYNQIQVIGMSSDNSTFESVTSIDYINTVTTARDTVYSSNAWNGNYNSILNYYYGDTVPNITSLNSDLNNLITFTTNVMASNLTLDFNTGQFYNNNDSYTSISVTGTTLNGSTFNSITSIAYKDTSQSIVDTAYNGGWNSGFSSQLSYYANQNVPSISILNSACNNLITFTLNAIAVSYQNTFVTGDFINAGDTYNRIDIIGTSSNNSTFTTITSIDYVNTNTNARDTVYSNSAWNGSYNSSLLYYSTMSQPNISAVNNAANGIIIFNVSLYNGSYEKTYNLTFYNNDHIYSSIKIIGTTSDNVKFNSISTIYYGNESVYINGWEQGFSSVLVQYDFMNELDLSEINSDANSVIVFSKLHVDSVDPSIKNNMLEGVQVIFYPITSFIALAQSSFPIAVILIMNVVGIVAVVIFSFVKRNKE